MAEEILEKLKQAILDYDVELSPILAKEALKEGLEPLVVMDALIAAVKIVGEKFGTGELFLPELVGAANALEAATSLVEEAILQSGMKRQTLGIVVIGTVAGDIHTIGKSMVTSLLTAEGFEVHDVGIDVSAEKFVQAVREYHPDILGLSALLSTTAPEAKVVIEKLKDEGLREKVKIMVGGGAMTAEFAELMGADGYEATAPGAVQLARGWIKA